MKKLIPLLAGLLATCLISLGQSRDWTKDDRNNIYNDCVSYTTQYASLTNEQRESVCLCYLNELTKQYSKSDYQAKIDIEVKRIRDATLTQCAKTTGVELAVKPKEEIKKQPDENNTAEIVPTKELIIGHWKDENSEFWIMESGDYKFQFNDGGILKGSWTLNNWVLTFSMEKFAGTKEYDYKILMFTRDRFVYQSSRNKKDTYTAIRIK